MALAPRQGAVNTHDLPEVYALLRPPATFAPTLRVAIVIHARIVDRDQSRYTVEELHRWKQAAEAEALKNLGRPQFESERPTRKEQQINAAVLIQGPNAISISGSNAVVLGPNAINIVGPIVQKDEEPPA